MFCVSLTWEQPRDVNYHNNYTTVHDEQSSYLQYAQIVYEQCLACMGILMNYD